jgi:hypothetical protein
MIVNTLAACLSGWRATSEREERMWTEASAPAKRPAGLKVLLSRNDLRAHSRRAVEIAFDHENGYIIVEGIAAKIGCGVIDIDHEILGGQ